MVTGYEQVIAHRTTDLFAYTAKQDGVVTTVTDKTIMLTYADGSVKYIETGRRFGKAKGSAYPHDVVANVKEGDKVKFGDLIVYNRNFFAKDFMDPKGVSWKAGVLSRTAIMDTTDTFEDSCAISEKLAEELTSETTFIRNVVVNFDQSISRLVEVGDIVEVDSILCTIEDSVTAKSDLFDDETLQSLRLLSSATPRAKHKGVVQKVEIFYNGEIVDMSETLGYLAQTHDRALSRLKKNLGKNKITGKVDSGYRIDGDPLGKNQLVVNVYITADVPAGVGDKGVFGNQLKTIIGRVMTGTNRSMDGKDIDGIFGYMSISNRTVLSPEIMGTTNALLEVIGLQAVEIYKGN